MALSGQAKKDYQRQYMRDKRNSTKTGNVRPKLLDPLQVSRQQGWTPLHNPDIDADGQEMYG